ncbi:hypothetical protein [Anaeromicrobium sediminis]|uniref:Dipeptidylpeptidase IV N-terminal domain-containing protein n=1 Tax=Anaeromicrobium sediminis TaxID=1478221 RepID=A0A267MCF3_9FIRM|nr:hypothetical protein [Anaeromicrobium sediminis]PAB57137.1 hypothetical protein CCE28_19600 [Anaeromicrobium sediminis]
MKVRFNKFRRITKYSVVLIVAIILAVTISGYIEMSKDRTIVIHSEKEEKEFLKEEETDLNVKNIYRRYTYGSFIRSNIIGWMDNENILEIREEDKKRSLNKVNYKYDFYSTVMNLKGEGRYGHFKLSPNGKKLIYTYNNDIRNKTKFFMRDLENSNETLIYESQYSSHNETISFSNNSKYMLLFIGNDFSSKLNKIIIYELENGGSREIAVDEWNNTYKFSPAKISNDGKKALVIGEDSKEVALYSVDLHKDTLKNNDRKKITNLTYGNVEFVDEDRIAFMTFKNNSLGIYDDETGKTYCPVGIIDNFKISHNSKYIIYSKYIEKKGSYNVYCGKLQGNKIINSKLIYQNFKPFDILWSTDNKKVIATGYTYDAKKDYSSNSIMDHHYIIIEFK